MNANEIVRVLREAPNYNAGTGTSTIEDEAADCIEALQAENKRIRKQADDECDSCACDLLNKRDAWRDQHAQAALNYQQKCREVAELEAQLAAEKRRAQDARNKLCLKCGRYREAHNGAYNGCR